VGGGGVMGAFWNVPRVDPLLWVSMKEIAFSTGMPTYLVEVRRNKYRVKALLIILFSEMLKFSKIISSKSINILE
jgi:hypothetical protein